MAKLGPMVESCSTLPPRYCSLSDIPFRKSSIGCVADFFITKEMDFKKRQQKSRLHRHQKSAGAWLSPQNDVLCNRLWNSKTGSVSMPAPANRTNGGWSCSILPVYRYRVGLSRLLLKYLWTYLFNCRLWIDFPRHHYTKSDTESQSMLPWVWKSNMPPILTFRQVGTKWKAELYSNLGRRGMKMGKTKDTNFFNGSCLLFFSFMWSACSNLFR